MLKITHIVKLDEDTLKNIILVRSLLRLSEHFKLLYLIDERSFRDGNADICRVLGRNNHKHNLRVVL